MSQLFKGYIKLWRDIQHEAVYKNATSKQRDIIIVLLMMAFWEDGVYVWKDYAIPLKKGEIITTLKEIRERCGRDMSIQNVRTILRNLSFREKFCKIEIVKLRNIQRHKITIDKAYSKVWTIPSSTSSGTLSSTWSIQRQLPLFKTKIVRGGKKSTSFLTTSSTRSLTQSKEVKNIKIKEVLSQQKKIIEDLKKMYPDIKENYIIQSVEKYLKKIPEYSYAKDPEKMIKEWFETDRHFKNGGGIYKVRKEGGGLKSFKDLMSDYKNSQKNN